MVTLQFLFAYLSQEALTSEWKGPNWVYDNQMSQLWPVFHSRMSPWQNVTDIFPVGLESV